MERAARYILHLAPTTKRYWNHPKIVFTKPKMLMSILLHDEGTVRQHEEEEDDHCERAQQERAP